jgi:hypothetical protein
MPAASRVHGLRLAVAGRYQVLLVLSGCLSIWFLRRPQQVWHPYVWAEESIVVRHFLDGGWLGAVRPVQGYVILPTTLLLPLAATVAFAHLPMLMFWLATGVFALTVVMLVGPESRWGGRGTTALMAFAMVLCPVNPETFGVLLYAFWWAALWPLIILGWKRDLWWARIPLLVIAALSSPAGAAMAIPFAVSWWWSRRRVELAGAAILAGGAVVELAAVLSSDRRDTISTSIAKVLEQSLVTLGLFPSPWVNPIGAGWGGAALAGLAVGAVLVTAVVESMRAQRSIEPLLLLIPVVLFTVLSSVPSPLVTSPNGDAARYYFLPFITIAWLLLTLLVNTRLSRATHILAGILLATAAIGLVSNFTRPLQTTTGRLDWRQELERCAESTSAQVDIPIYTDGSTRGLWTLRMTPAECRARL